MSSLDAFHRAAPASFAFQPLPFAHDYKYVLAGKGCTLGVIFEDSVNVYFEWLTENGTPVAYAPDSRYKFWPKHHVAQLVRCGWYEVEGPALAATVA